MSLQDRIAKRLLKDHRDQCERIAGSFFTSIDDHQKAEPAEYRRAEVAFGPDGGLKLSCLVADQQDMQVQGLQKHSELGMYEGMLFPYEKPRKVSFHMGEVKFPIDIIFVGSDGRVTKKVENIEPGSPGRWGMDHVSAVIEANGGFCASHNVEVGMHVAGLTNKTAQLRSGQVFVVWDNANDPQASGHVCFKASSPQEAAKFFELHMAGQDMLSAHGGMVPDEWGDTSTPPTIVQTDSGSYGVDGPYNDPELSGDTGIDSWTVSDPSSGGSGPAMASKHAQQNNGFGTVDHGGQQFTVAEDMMEVDQGVMGGGIRYAVMFSPSQDVFWAEDSRAGHMIAGPCKSMQELGMQLGTSNRQAQESYPRAPRKDLNPKMMPPTNETPDRFRDRDLVDQQVMNQTAPAYSETQGYDPLTYHDNDDAKPTRMAVPGGAPDGGGPPPVPDPQMDRFIAEAAMIENELADIAKTPGGWQGMGFPTINHFTAWKKQKIERLNQLKKLLGM